MKKKIIIVISVVVFLGLVALAYFFLTKTDISFKKLEVEINETKTVGDFISEVKNGALTNKDEKVDTSKLGKVEVIAKIKKNIGIKDYKFKVKIIDTEKPKIEYTKEFKTTVGTEVDLLKGVKVTDNSKEKMKMPTIEGEYDFNKEGTYKLKYVAKDSSGNTAKEEFTVIVTKKVTVNNGNNKNPYYIKVNRKQNVVMVYGLENGEYTKLVKTFVCSTGTDTPLGTFNTPNKYVWRPLVNNVYGQYATRITGSILFHSVPYYKQSKDTLEYEEYNKLGTKASLGCIRLTVIDAKWIYDNCPLGTTVTIYDSDSLNGIKKPTAPKIDVNSKNRGWDPTDPDPNNPWK